MDVSGRILRTWVPAIHAGMTSSAFLCSAGERKIMNHFVVTPFFFLVAAFALRPVFHGKPERTIL